MKSLPAGHRKERIDELTDRQAASFLNPNAIKPILLEPGDKLWRMVSKQHGRRFSDFWMDPDTMSQLMNVFVSWGVFSEAQKKSVVRDNCAILDAWKSNLSWRCQIKLSQPVVGYLGQIGPQKVFSENASESKQYGRPVEQLTEFRIGGFNQIVIPRFAGLKEEETGKWGTVTHFARL